MKLRALEDTPDGRIKAGKLYEGQFLFMIGVGGRIVVYCDNGTWADFSPKLFEPA